MMYFGRCKKERLLCVMFLIGLFFASNSMLRAQFPGGDGTANNPWQISNVGELNAVRGYLGSGNADKHFIQTADIDLRGVNNWSPIGVSSLMSFRGKYDGGNYVIKNLKINRPDTAFQGLFGFVVDAEMKNIGLIDVNIHSGNSSGSLAGSQQGGRIDGCFATGKVHGSRDAGGLVGSKSGANSYLTNSYSMVKVHSFEDRVGGLVGYNQDGQIRFCYAAGYVEGIVREESRQKIGAIIGSVGGGVIANNYWNIELCGQAAGCSDYSIPGRTSQEMMRRMSYVAWDFPAIWVIEEEESFPYLEWSGEAAPFNYPNLMPPQEVAAVSGDGRIELSWEAGSVGEPDGYNVYRAIGDDGTTRLNEELITESHYLDTDVVNNEQYRYHVTAIYNEIESLPSLLVRIRPFAIGGGSGTEESPYTVATATHLDVLRLFAERNDGVHYHFRQTSDIDLAEWNGGNGWNPIGDESNQFKGTYDGGGFSIKNLTVSGGGNYQGLFGSAGGSVFKNVRLTGVVVENADSYVGGLVGYISEGSEVLDCFVDGSISGVSYVGGLVGYLHGSSVERSYSSGKVNAFESPSHVGGLVGYKTNAASLIKNSYSTAQVTGNQRNVGGLVGTNWNGTIINCYAAGSVFAASDEGATGGLVGHHQTGEIVGSYWNIQSTGQEESGGGGEGKNTLQMLQQATFQPDENRWDFAEIWAIETGVSYPHLHWQETAGVHNKPGPYGLTYQQGDRETDVVLTWDMVGAPTSYRLYRNGTQIANVVHPDKRWEDKERNYFTEYTYYVVGVYVEEEEEKTTSQSNSVSITIIPSFTGGTGSRLNPYRVSTAAMLRLVADSLHCHFIQTANIDLGTPPWNSGEGWRPIGSPSKAFTGSFKGNGFTISNLYINRNDDYQGLFGYSQGENLEDVTLENANVSGNQYVGGLVGYHTGDIRNCYVSGTMIVNTNYVGGVCGYATSNINGCVADVNVSSGGSYVGGLGGWLTGEIVNSSVSGYVTGSGSYIGGLIGYNQAEVVGCSSAITVESSSSYVGGLIGYTTAIVVECSSSGYIRGYSYVGGLVGGTTNDVIIRDCYSQASVYGTYREVGGLVGYSRGVIERCYALGQVTGDNNFVGGLVGHKRYGTANIIIDSYAMGTVTNTRNAQDAVVGGLVGNNFEGQIINCYSTGSVVGFSNTMAGGLVGSQEENAQTSGSFWNTETSGKNTSAGGTGRTTTQMFQRNTYTAANWDFIQYWRIEQGETYPYLMSQNDFSHNRPAVRSLSAQASNGAVQLQWQAPSQGEIEGYNLYRNDVLVNTDELIRGREYIDRDLMNYKTYRYYVKGVISAEENTFSGTSNVVEVIPKRGSFTDGNGSAGNPYVIDSGGALWEMRRYLGTEHVNTYFKITTDIDLGVAPFNEGQGWLPIGDATAVENRFYGHLEGDGHKITNMTINRGGSDYVGLIGYLINGSIQNVVLENVNVQGRNYVGGLVGQLNNSPIINCAVTGTVRGSTYTGGVIGYQTGANSNITACYSVGAVKGSNYCGGLVGFSAQTNQVANCYSVASVAGASYIGGLIGDSRSTVTYSYSTGLVRGTGSEIGPFVGRVAGGSIGQNCYWNNESSGHIEVAGTTFGGHGQSTFEMTQQDTYQGWNFNSVWRLSEDSYPYLQWQEEVAECNYPLPVPPSNLFAQIGNSRVILTWRTPSLMQPLGYRVYRDGREIAQLAPSQSYKDTSATNNVLYTYYLTAFYSDERESQPSNSVLAASVAGGFAGGRGTREEPYMVATPEQLNAIRYNPFKHYIQIANINLNAYNNWEPIGPSTTSLRFTGSYDGDQYVISNLRRTTASTYSGLFGYNTNAEFRNIGIENSSFVGGTYSGTLAGYSQSATVDNCYAIGRFQGTGTYTGGLFGYMSSSKVDNCFADVAVTSSGTYLGGLIGGNSSTAINNSFALGEVTATSTSTSVYAGGLVGYNMSTITNCYATGNVTAPRTTGEYVGGLTGRSTGNITGSYATGDVSGNRYIGGLVGYNTSGITNSCASGTISGNIDVGGLIGDNRIAIGSCYSIGRVLPGGENIGGLIGVNVATVSASYWNTQTSGLNTSAGGEGRNTEEMTYPHAVNTYINWNFNTMWVPDVDGDINGGYPFHIWKSVTVSPFPRTASSPAPANEATNVALTLPRVEWEYRPSVLYQNPVGFRVYLNTTGDFDEESPFEWVNFVNGQIRYANGNVLPNELERGKMYYWKVVPTTINPNEQRDGESDKISRKEALTARSSRGSSTRGNAENCPIWCFRAVPHSDPVAAIRPNPADESEDVSISIGELSWEYKPHPAHTDPYGFRVYFGIEEEFGEEYEWVVYDEEETQFSVELEGLLELNTTYYWKVIPTTTQPGRGQEGGGLSNRNRRSAYALHSRDTPTMREDAKDCPVWKFTTAEVNPNPAVAVNPNPEDGKEDVSVNIEKLQWDYIDTPEYVKPVGFKVYMDEKEDFDEWSMSVWIEYKPEQITYQAPISINLTKGTTYYWQVIPTTIENNFRDDFGDKTGRDTRLDRSRTLPITRGDADKCPVWSFTIQRDVGVDNLLPIVTRLKGNYPNPFNPSTTISFHLGKQSNVSVVIFNIKGQTVRTLLNAHMERGEYQIEWDGFDDNNSPVGSGLYYYRMVSDDYVSTNKMILIK